MGRAYLISISEKSRRRHVARFRDRANQQIRTVPDVGEAAEKSCRHRNGGEAASVTRRKFCDIWKTINVEMIETEGGGKKGKIGRRIIEQTGAPVKTRSLARWKSLAWNST